MRWHSWLTRPRELVQEVSKRKAAKVEQLCDQRRVATRSSLKETIKKILFRMRNVKTLACTSRLLEEPKDGVCAKAQFALPAYRKGAPDHHDRTSMKTYNTVRKPKAMELVTST